MSHNITGYVAKHNDLLRVFGRAAVLPFDLGFMPIDDYSFNPREEIVIAKIQKLAWVETRFHGGAGTQSAKLWENGKLVYEEEDSHQSLINAVLKRLGVKKGASDEFDAVNFGHCRENEDFSVREITSEDRMQRQMAWNDEQCKRAPEMARVGDYVKLLVQWKDVSGIPLVTYPPGTILKVLVPDLTTGGVVVQYEEVTFSLSPDEYEMTVPDE